MLVDTHCHLDFKDFDRDRDEIVARARQAGVERIINVGSSLEGSRRAVELAAKYASVYASVGIHPHEAQAVSDAVIAELRTLAQKGISLEGSFSSPSRDDFSIEKSKVVAIGEVGLDYYRNLSPKGAQIEAFKKFIDLALELHLPLILHAREADGDILLILKEYARRSTLDARRINGVMHCFSGDRKFLEECLGLGLYISFTCNLTFRNARALREVAKAVPVERLLLETDAPFLAPEGQRGRRNEPANVALLAGEWTRLLSLSRSDIARITTHNAKALFGLDIDEAGPKIAYPIRESLYLNITNLCTNKCDFCIREVTDFVKGHNLRLAREPSADEILEAIGEGTAYKEMVFCGYGEPTTRLDVIKLVAAKIRGYGDRGTGYGRGPGTGVKVRLVTNGQGDLINSRPIAKELKGLVDRVSVSLNADTDEGYYRLCAPKFGARTYAHILEFIKDCVANGIETEVTCLDMPGVNIGRCEAVAKGLGASFRLRRQGAAG